MNALLRELADVLFDRSAEVAFQRGATVILLAIAATWTVVGAIMAACGCGAWCLLLGVPLLLPAAGCAVWVRALRDDR